MKHLFILNPIAGKYNRTAELKGKIADLVSAVGDTFDIQVTEYQGHGAQLAAAAAVTGEPLRIYACGGDGTFHEVVNGAAGHAHVAATHYPTGSGNDFIKIFGPDATMFYDLPALLKGTVSPIDLIDCNGRQAANICSVGFDARIGLEMSNFKRFPLVTGSMAYQLSLVNNLVKGINRPYHVEVDGEVFEGEFALLCACNGRYYGGSFNPAPHAVPDDGLLDFLIVKAVSRLTVATVVNHYAAGRAADFPQLITLRRGKEMKVVCDRVSMINLDGERLDADKLSFCLSAKKLNLIHPQGTHWNPAMRST